MSFSQLPDTDLDEFTTQVIDGLTGNAAFPTPPVTMANLATGRTNFVNAMAATAQGGTQATAAKNAARDTLVGLLRQEANYVQGAANNDLTVLLTSGFDANSTNRAQTPLDKPDIVKILNEASTQLVVRVTPITNAKSYEARISTVPNVWQAAGTHTQARRIVLMNLTPGTVYTISVRAVGGSTGFSDWSDPVSHMCM